MKPSLAVQFLSTVFIATAVSSSSASVAAEELAKKYDIRNADIDAAAAATSRVSRNLVSIHTNTISTSKSSKASVSCPPEPTKDVQCGNVYNSTATDEEVVVTLGQNLLCNENITEADNSTNAALTLAGEKAVLNCQGYTISQTTVNIDGIDTGSAAAMDCNYSIRNGAELLIMKQECGLFYEWGVILTEGARMVNCNIQKFFLGAGIRNGGEIVDSQFNLNKRGVQILNNDAANTVSKVANSEFYNNFDGLKAYQLIQDNSKVMIEDVISENNKREGIYLTGTGISVNNAKMRNNPQGLKIGPVAENEISLAGDVSITNSEKGIVTRSNTQGTVYVTGNLISNRNVVGLQPLSDNFTIAVGGSYSGKSGKSGGSGSLMACDNSQYDIDNKGPSTFEGSDYICDTTNGTNLPDCKPCHPGCPSPSPSPPESAEFIQFQQMVASFEADDDDDDDDDPVSMEVGKIPGVN